MTREQFNKIKEMFEKEYKQELLQAIEEFENSVNERFEKEKKQYDCMTLDTWNLGKLQAIAIIKKVINEG